MAMKQRGATRYDMWGLSEREGDDLAGIENFKLGFGGEVVEWIGAFDRPVVAPFYPVWRFAGRRRLPPPPRWPTRRRGRGPAPRPGPAVPRCRPPPGRQT